MGSWKEGHCQVNHSTEIKWQNNTERILLTKEQTFLSGSGGIAHW